MAEFTKEEYLEMRRQGVSRNGITKAKGMKPGTLYYWLDKWGLKGSDAEREALTGGEKPQEAHADVFEVTSTQEGAEVSEPVQGHSEPSEDVSAEPQYIIIRIPVYFDELPNDKPSYDRDELIQSGVKRLQVAAAWAYRELLDLLGDVEVAQVQQFMNRKTGQQ